MENISAFGGSMVLAASTTFPAGITLTQWADDVDPLDVPDQEIAQTAYGVNGTMVAWSRATGLDVAVAVVPNGNDDRNLALLTEANRVSYGKRSADDVLTLTVMYADGRKKIFSQGKLVNGSPALGISQSGRLKTRTYRMRFQSVTG